MTPEAGPGIRQMKAAGYLDGFFSTKIKWILIFGGCFVLICQAPRDESDLPIPAFGAVVGCQPRLKVSMGN